MTSVPLYSRVRSFAGGKWTTRGSGNDGGQNSSPLEFTGSLNFDQSKDGRAPAIGRRRCGSR
jgi:hypothetical protein